MASSVSEPAARDAASDEAFAADGRAWPWLTAAALFVLTGYRLVLLAADLLPLFPDEAQYVSWARSFEFGYFSKPPMVAWWIGLAQMLCGDGEACVRLPALAGWTATAVLVYLIGRRLFDRRVGFYAAIAFATRPAAWMLSLVVTTDAPLLLFWALACWLVVPAIEHGTFRYWLLAGLAGGLGLMSKYTMVLFPASVALYLLFDPARRRELLRPGFVVACALALALFVPNVLWNAGHGFVSFVHTAEISQLDRALFHPEAMATFLAGQLAVFGPLLFLVLVAQLADWRWWWHDPRRRLLVALGATFLAAVTLQALLSRANYNWALPTYVAGSVLAVAWLLARGRRRWLHAALALNLVLGVTLNLYPSAARLAGFELPARLDLFSRFRGWPEVGEQLRAHLDAYPDAALLGDDRKTLAEMLYYARPAAWAAWNPDGVVDDHYKLTADLRDARARRFIVLARHLTGEALAGRFRSVRELPPITVRTHADRVLRYRVFEAEDFQGY